MGKAEVDECEAGERHAPGHGAQPEFQSAAGGEDAADDASEGQADDADGAVDNADFGGGEAEASGGHGVEEEGVDELDELRLGETVEEHEDDGHPDLLLAEELGKDVDEFIPYLTAVEGAGGGGALHFREGPGVVEGEAEEEDG